MNLVIIESPLKGAVPSWAPRWLAPTFERIGRWRNKRCARACMRDSLARGEAPYASHLLYDQRGILNDADDAQRVLGMNAGSAWSRVGATRAFYVDRGFSGGMMRGRAEAEAFRQAIAFRSLKWSPTTEPKI